MHRRKSRVGNGGSQARPTVCFEPLESRLLMSAAGPSIISMTADNRGQIVLTADTRLDPTTTNDQSIKVFLAGADGLLGTDDDQQVFAVITNPSSEQILIRAQVPTDARYRVFLDSSIIRDSDGRALDGEFNGANSPSGDGVAGGDFDAFVRRAVRTIVRFTTTVGTIDVELFGDRTPLTVANFLGYANAGSWDNTFFHRSAELPNGDPFVIQGGGFNADSQLTSIPQNPPVLNEPGISNTRGTLAVAKLGNNPNSGTNQWFFNLGNNASNLDSQNGGFTVFGRVLDEASLAIMDAIASLGVFDASSQGNAFNEVPVRNVDNIVGGRVTPSDLIIVSRIAVFMDVSGEPSQQLSDDGALVIQNPNGAAKVTIFDLSGSGLDPAALDSVRVKFGNDDSVRSVTIKGAFTDAPVGIRIEGSGGGSFTDNRRGATNIAFVIANTSLTNLKIAGALSGYNLNDYVLPGGFTFDPDIDGDGDVDDKLAVFVASGLINKLQVSGDLLGSVMAPGGVRNVVVQGTSFDADFRLGNSGIDRPTTSSFRFGLVDNTTLDSALPITTLSAFAWTNSANTTVLVKAPSIGTLSITGDRSGGVLGDFSSNIDLLTSSTTSDTLGRMAISGSALGGQWRVNGSVGSVAIGGDTSGVDLRITGDLDSFTAGRVLATGVSATGAVGRLSAIDWNGGDLAAGTLDRMTINGDSRRGIAGDFFGFLTVSGQANTEVTRSILINGSVGQGIFTFSSGSVRDVTIRGNTTAWDLRIGAGDLRSLTMGEVNDTRVDLRGLVNQISFTSWNGGEIRGRTFFNIDSLGDTRTGNRGDFLANISVDGIQKLNIAGDLQGTVTFRAAEDLFIGGSVRDSVINVTQGFASGLLSVLRLDIAGSMVNSDLRAATSIGAVTTSAMLNSGIYIGAPATHVGLPDNATGFDTRGALQSLTINGLGGDTPSFVSSSVVAGQLGTIRITNPDTNNLGTPFGVAGQTIQRIETRLFPNQRVVQVNPTQTLPPLGDYQVRVNFAPPA